MTLYCKGLSWANLDFELTSVLFLSLNVKSVCSYKKLFGPVPSFRNKLFLILGNKNKLATLNCARGRAWT